MECVENSTQKYPFLQCAYYVCMAIFIERQQEFRLRSVVLRAVKQLVNLINRVVLMKVVKEQESPGAKLESCLQVPEGCQPGYRKGLNRKGWQAWSAHAVEGIASNACQWSWAQGLPLACCNRQIARNAALGKSRFFHRCTGRRHQCRLERHATWQCLVGSLAQLGLPRRRSANIYLLIGKYIN